MQIGFGVTPDEDASIVHTPAVLVSIQNRVGVASCQERYMILLKNYIESVRSFGEAIYLFPKILNKIGELRYVDFNFVPTHLNSSPQRCVLSVFNGQTIL